jgi:hypothetical protein
MQDHRTVKRRWQSSINSSASARQILKNFLKWRSCGFSDTLHTTAGKIRLTEKPDEYKIVLKGA